MTDVLPAPPAAGTEAAPATALNFLIIGDISSDRTSLELMLAAEFPLCSFRTELTLAAGLGALAESAPACIILDMALPEASSLEGLNHIFERAQHIPVIALTDPNDEFTGREAVVLGAQDHLVKGNTDSTTLARSVRYAVDRKRAEQEHVIRTEAPHASLGGRAILQILLVIVLGVGITSAGSWYWSEQNASNAQTTVNSDASKASDQLASLLSRSGSLIAGSAELFEQDISPNAYTSYLDAVGYGSSKFPGVLGIGIIERVPAAQLPQFLAELRQNGVATTSVVPAGARPQYCLASRYATSTHLRVSIPLYGFDLCTFSTLNAALNRATATDQQVVLPGSNIAPAYEQDMLLISPAYALGPAVVAGVTTDPSLRQTESIGWALTIVDGRGMLNSVSASLGLGATLTYGLFRASAGSEHLIVDSAGFARSPVSSTRTIRFDAYGHWVLEVRMPSGSPLSGRYLLGPLLALLFGLSATGLLAALLFSISTSRARAESAVDKALRSWRSSEQRYRALVDAAPIGIFEGTRTLDFGFANHKLAEICGRDLSELTGKTWIDIVHPDDLPSVMSVVDEIRHHRVVTSVTFRIVRPLGEVRHVRMLASPGGDEVDGDYVLTVEDISDGVQAREQLEFQAYHDALTGLPNRALFLDRLTQDLARRQHAGKGVAVLFVDLDHFKNVNDTFGHDVGDALLRNVAERFLVTVRAGDTLARLGGDEFTFVMNDVSHAGEATAAATRFLTLLRSPVRCAERDIQVTASIGIAVAAPGASAIVLMRDADTAMYQAKEAGRDRYMVFEETQHNRAVSRFSVESDLRAALDRGQLEVYFQPVLNLSTQLPLGAEALVRWNHPTRGLVLPLDFIPVAEESGLIEPLGRWVIDQALSQFAAWRAGGEVGGFEHLAVNVSAPQLDNPATVDAVAEALDKYEIDPRLLTLEITESVAMRQNAASQQSLQRLRTLGVTVAIDDFGTGHSSLAHLHEIPVGIVKVDSSFVERLGAADDSTPVVTAIIQMARALGLGVVAEGVSSADLARRVAVLGCDSAQGFYWAKPMPADQFAAWWAEAMDNSGAMVTR
ncbi:MAG: bifunctional diguanylate cyclase/phosphodiesterase [Acidimicrobiales bacterium]